MTVQLKHINFQVLVEALKGETECGDDYLVKELDNHTLLVVVDGLGHGREAAFAAKKAIETVKLNAHQPIEILFKLCNEALSMTRGAAMTIVTIDSDQTITYKAVGNVAGVYWHIEERAKLRQHSFLLDSGIVGSNSPTHISAKKINLTSGDIIILATDGIKAQFENTVPRWDTPDKIAHHMFTTYRNNNDDGLVLVVQLI